MKRRRIAALTGLSVVAYFAGANAGVARMRRAMADVAPDLRSPILPLTSRPLTDRSLWLARLSMARKTKAGSGVDVALKHVDANPPVRVYVTTPTAATTRRPAVLLLHGGGLIAGSPQAEAFEAGRIARELDAVVISPEYRLAPENPFPAALDDCMVALKWIRANADELGVDAERIAVAGFSAGGGLGAAVAQRATDEGIALRAQALVYPMLDDRTALREHRGRGAFMWTPASSRWAWTAYLGRCPQMSGAPQYAAPARRVDLSGLPPAWLGVGDLDILFDESVDYAERLKSSGVPCELVTVAGMYHGADGIRPKVPAMQNFRRGMYEHLRTYL